MALGALNKVGFYDARNLIIGDLNVISRFGSVLGDTEVCSAHSIVFICAA